MKRSEGDLTGMLGDCNNLEKTCKRLKCWKKFTNEANSRQRNYDGTERNISLPFGSH